MGAAKSKLESYARKVIINELDNSDGTPKDIAKARKQLRALKRRYKKPRVRKVRTFKCVTEVAKYDIARYLREEFGALATRERWHVSQTEIFDSINVAFNKDLKVSGINKRNNTNSPRKAQIT